MSKKDILLKNLGVPIKLLHESLGFICTVELKNGETYRGLVVDVEDNWNIQMQKVCYTSRDGVKRELEHIYIRGSNVRLLLLPDMLKNSPIFSKISSQHTATTEPVAKKPRRNE